jgi:hypothetical protein
VEVHGVIVIKHVMVAEVVYVITLQPKQLVMLNANTPEHNVLTAQLTTMVVVHLSAQAVKSA